MAVEKSLEVDFRDLAHDPRIVPGNTLTYLRTIQGFYKEILDYPVKYYQSSAQQLIRQILYKYDETYSTLAELYGSEHRLIYNEISIKIYTFQSCIYVQLNNALRNDEKEVLLLFSPHIYI
ncbi:unnamed protein product [Rotaria sordida]|uniref:Uncharacterized protein n=1 Tax=Rotaria sordida TaxID=392033 RepID=A0A816AB73_9BILA|nr:unnamed protein product [Rotaria sordida]CAF1595806.1 unnamed protein product [Rotaria sordida]